MKPKIFDFVILGGGCAALSLASLFNNNINNCSFLILEKEKIY